MRIPHTLRRPVAFPLACVVIGLAVSIAACGGRYESDFPIVAVNHTVNTLQVLANGEAVKEVAAERSQSFTPRLPESNQNIYSNGVAPTPQAQVTFAAKDLRTGMLSDEKSMTLTASTATYVTFDIEDFPSASRTVARSPSRPRTRRSTRTSFSTRRRRARATARSPGTSATGRMAPA